MKKSDQEKKEYELLPHKELMELKEELRQLKEFEITPTKKLEISVVELNKKLDKLIDIFERASQDMRVEEGGLSFREKMRPVVDKMNKILEQNAEIASGILAIADLVKGRQENKFPKMQPSFTPPKPPMPPKMPGPPGMPKQGMQYPQMQPPKAPPKGQFRQMPPSHSKPPQTPSTQAPPKEQFRQMPGAQSGINIRPAQPSGNLPPPPQKKKRSFGL